MKHLTLFNSKQELVDAVNNGTIAKPNVSLVQGEKNCHYFGDTEAGDIAYWDGDMVCFIPCNMWEESLGEPIGVVVVPSTHTEDGKSIVMSLANMSLQNPEKGSLAKDAIDGDNYMPWGDYGVDVPNLLTNNQVPVTDLDGVSQGTDSWGHANIGLKNGSYSIFQDEDDNVVGSKDKAIKETIFEVENGYVLGYVIMMRDSLDDDEWYQDDSEDYDTYIQSPYNADGSRNEDFFMEGTILEEGLNGKANTQAILAMCSNANKTATPVSKVVGTNGNGSDKKQNYPAAICASRYHTVGTKSGDWYLPSIAEMLYFFARYNTIKASLEKLGDKAVGLNPLMVWSSTFGAWLWSSSEYSVDIAWYCSSDYAYVRSSAKNNTGDNYRVRAFSAF